MTPQQRVFEAFQHYRKAIGKSKPRMTDTALKKIAKALDHASAKDLLILFDFLKSNETEYARFINGDNENKRFYGTLDNLLRSSKLQEKINRATKWRKQVDEKLNNAPKALYVPFIIVETQQTVTIKKGGSDK